jgi:hypothetical protein
MQTKNNLKTPKRNAVESMRARVCGRRYRIWQEGCLIGRDLDGTPVQIHLFVVTYP